MKTFNRRERVFYYVPFFPELGLRCSRVLLHVDVPGICDDPAGLTQPLQAQANSGLHSDSDHHLGSHDTFRTAGRRDRPDDQPPGI